MAAQTRRVVHRSSFLIVDRAIETPTIFTLFFLAALAFSATALPAAEPAVNPGHALAQRFAEDTERARAAEAARNEAARKAAVLRRKQAAEKTAKEKAEKVWEAEMLARARKEAEERRQLETEAARLDALRMAREAKEAEVARREAEIARSAEEVRKTEAIRHAEEKRKAEEVERAAEALRMAAERAAQEDARKAAEAGRIAEEKARDAQRVEAERLAEETRRVRNERLAEEGRRAEAQRIETARKAEEAARRAEAARQAEHAAWQAEEASRAEQIRKANEALRIAAEKAAEKEVAERAAAARRAEETQREVARATEEEARRIGALEADAEVERVAARLRAIREQHLARHMRTGEGTEDRARSPSAQAPAAAPDGAIGRLGVSPSPDVARAPAASEAPEVHRAADAPSGYSYGYDDRHDGRVTVLLQMEPSAYRGRRHESMDPILCLADGCYVSNGPHHPASFLPGRRATRFGNAIGRRAGACNRAYTCVFRDVEIGALPAEVQPVDIRVLRHDRRAPESIDALSTCRSTSGRLACTGAIHGDGYTMWIIPETTAARLPIDLFGTTRESGFGREPRAEYVPRRSRW